MEYISFPGLGIEPFHIDGIAFKAFGRPIMWYGVIICIGIILSVCYAIWRSKTESIKTDDIIDLAFFLVIFGIIGARLYYVIFSFDKYLVTGQGFFGNLWGTLKKIVGVWNGGLAIYRALIAGFITIAVFCKLKKISLLKMVDAVSPAVMIGQILGRWGNFMNIEAHGSTTTLPWRMGIGESSTSITQYVHPTFFYESMWNLMGFIIANIIYKKKKFDGQIFFFYIGWYGFGRMIIEGLRTDSLPIGPYRVSQLVGFVTFVLGVVMTVVSVRLMKNVDKDEVEESEAILAEAAPAEVSVEIEEEITDAAETDTIEEEKENGKDN